MNEPSSSGEVVWSRVYDEGASRRRWKRLVRWYVLPMTIALALGALFGGWGTVLGLLILLGGIGGMVALWIWLHGFLLQQNPTIRLVDGELVQGRKAVPIDAIEAWTTYRRTRVTRAEYVASPLAQVIFRVAVYRDGERATRPDGGPAYDTVLFGWGEMPPEELEEVRAALEPHIDAPWVEPGELRT